ncbi:hypothetical protein BD626DRAFT_576470 [Schizophyllum amplum]|uniref:F-box domain-containing protein n=1 Tax=Schizophyllum amplum TaxID=97359 RepID=A0A550BTG2_9AGAR|nr:hypothetical protein BD626DRAFT_576470 [Auriculariopsis ampla]
MHSPNPLDIAELVDIILEYLSKDDASVTLARARCVNRLWCSSATHRLWRKVDLSAVLRLLPRDAWFIYEDDGRDDEDSDGDIQMDKQGSRHLIAYERGEYSHRSDDFENPTFILRRLITEDEWSALLPFTRHVKFLYTIGGPGDPDSLPSLVGISFKAVVVYDTLSRCLPSFQLFPQLEELVVLDYGNNPESMRLFDSDVLRVMRMEMDTTDGDAAACLDALTDVKYGVCPVQYVVIDNSLVDHSDVSAPSALGNALRACDCLQRLHIDSLQMEGWCTVAAMPFLTELFVVDMGTYCDLLPSSAFIPAPLAFPSLRVLCLELGMDIFYLSLLLRMRDGMPWELEKLHMPAQVDVCGNSARTMFNLIQAYVSAGTLESLIINCAAEPETDLPFDCIEPLLGFSNLTFLYVYTSFDCEPHFQALDRWEVNIIAGSFPRMRELHLSLKFPVTSLVAFAQFCPELEALKVGAFVDRDLDYVDAAATRAGRPCQSMKLKRLDVGARLHEQEGPEKDAAVAFLKGIFPAARFVHSDDIIRGGEYFK